MELKANRLRTAIVVGALAILCTTFAPSAAAAPFNLVENVNNALDCFPDRPGDPFKQCINHGTGLPNPNHLVADIGINIAGGSLSNCFGFGCKDDFDAFRMIVPQGVEIYRTELYTTTPDFTSNQLLVFLFDPNVIIDRRPPPGTIGMPTQPCGTCIINLFANVPTSPAVSQYLMGPGTYEVLPVNHLGLGSAGDVWEARFYARQASAQAPNGIPAPSALLLFGAAFIASRVVRRRDARRAVS